MRKFGRKCKQGTVVISHRLIVTTVLKYFSTANTEKEELSFVLIGIKIHTHDTNIYTWIQCFGDECS